MSERTFLKGALFLSLAGIFSKIMGLILKMRLSVILGPEGSGIYSYPQQFYVMMIAISATGFASSISKLVAEKRSVGKMREAHRVFRVSLVVMLVLSGIITFLMLLFIPVAMKIWGESVYYAYIAVAVGPIFVSIMTSFRGYFQGMQLMQATSVSQVFESAARLVFGLGLAAFFAGASVAKAAGGASFGAAAGGVVGFGIILIYYMKNRGGIMSDLETDHHPQDKTSWQLAKELIAFTLPITVNSVIVPLMPLFDSLLIKPRAVAGGYSPEMVDKMYAWLSSAVTVNGLPLTFTLALAVSLIPAVSKAVAKNDMPEANRKINLSLRLGFLIGFPCFMGFLVIPEEIMVLLFPTFAGSGYVLQAYAICLIFMIVSQLMSYSLQGIGRPRIATKNLMIGSAIKLFLSYFLIAWEPAVGASIATLSAYLFISISNFRAVKHFTQIQFDKRILYAPMTASIVMGIGTYFVNRFFANTLLSIGTAAVIYFVGVVVFGGIRKDEIKEMIGR